MYSPKSKFYPQPLPPQWFLKFTFLLLECDQVKLGKDKDNTANRLLGKGLGPSFDLGE